MHCITCYLYALSMKKLFLKYVTITDYTELKRYILSYPVLLSAAIEEVVDKMISSDQNNTLPGTTINKNIQLLKEARRHGTYQVFPEEFPKELSELPAPSEKEMVFVPAGECTIGSNEGNAEKKEAPASVVELEAS